ncbi:Dual specificity phosphatase [Spironucleus salmonicida]|uniref:Dual specificity phosphatase n=1 Tax=Spironucleus salmonicida TaxID=348837 RepID=V6LRA2_9EUKA|nr:Dual specificity phosphatase [Spironucleus salmonicida]|eukprot:EST46216.1 Dual specificity phosphatase [Spironucleus salmonicida]
MKLYNKIVKNLYLGNAACQKLSEKPEDAKVCVTFGVKDTGAPKWAEYYIFFNLEDKPTVDPQYFLKLMQESFQFIKEHIEYRPILVHCGLGVSRSGAAAVYYVMKTQNLSYYDAFSYVQSKRTCVLPNQGFANALTSINQQ